MPDFRRHTHSVIKTMEHACDRLKVIAKCFLSKLHFRLIIIKTTIRLLFPHGNPFVAAAQPDSIYIVFRRAETDRHLVIYIRLRGIPVIFGPVRKHRMFTQDWTHLHHILLSLAQFINGIFFHIMIPLSHLTLHSNKIFLRCKKGSSISCLFRRRYFYYGV